MGNRPPYRDLPFDSSLGLPAKYSSSIPDLQPTANIPMPPVHPPKDFAFFDEGRGEPVILLHSSLSSSRQWRRLQQQIGHRYRLLGPDILGYGETPMPGAPGDFTFDQEVDLVERLLDLVESPAHLVGHSYGGSIALKTALRHPNRVRSIYAHEPVLLALLKSEGKLAEWTEISGVTLKVTELTRQGRPDLAAERFIDYWSGPGSWQKIPADRRAPITGMMPKLVLDFAAIARDTDPLSAYGTLAMPIQLTAGDTGAQTARCVAKLLNRVWPGSLEIVEGAGHMAPLTDADRVNAIIARHLEAHSTRPRAG